MHKYFTVELNKIPKLENISFLDIGSVCLLCVIFISSNISDTPFLAFNNSFQFIFPYTDKGCDRGARAGGDARPTPQPLKLLIVRCWSRFPVSYSRSWNRKERKTKQQKTIGMGWWALPEKERWTPWDFVLS